MPANIDLYLAVKCEKGHIIPLAHFEFLPDNTAKPIDGQGPFGADCTLCNTHELFQLHQVIMWLGSPPSETFQTHPNFR